MQLPNSHVPSTSS